MIRKLKSLGFTLFATFVLCAAVASPASSYEGKITSTGPFTLDGTETTPGSIKFTVSGFTITCTESKVTGHKTVVYSETEAGKTHELIPNGSSTFTLTLDINNSHCTVTNASGTHKATMTMNGCDYDVTITETIVTNSVYAVDFSQVCPKEKSIEVDVYPFSGSELGGVICNIKLKEQSNLPGGREEDTGEHLRMTGTITGIHAERSGSGCSTETTTGCEIHLDVTLTGTNASGSTTALDLSHP